MDATRTTLEQLERDLQEDSILVLYEEKGSPRKLHVHVACGDYARVDGFPLPELLAGWDPMRGRDEVVVPLDAVIAIEVRRHSSEAPFVPVAAWLGIEGSLRRFTR